MQNKDEDVFLKSIAGTSPLKKNNKIEKEAPKDNPKKHRVEKKLIFNMGNKREEPAIRKQDLSNADFEEIGMRKKIKQGKIKIEKKIDFHGLSLFEAEDLFTNSIKTCYEKNQRCILFVTGKGLTNKNNEEKNKLYYGKIRNSFFSWVNKQEAKKYILSYDQATIEFGADGAFFVYLRKKKTNVQQA